VLGEVLPVTGDSHQEDSGLAGVPSP
jgi:hypothetical protein